MLDPARHFLSKEFVKRYIDLLAFYKLNRLHLHLTDAEGWRIEIKRYPELTDVSRWPRKLADRKQDDYRQQDIREIVAYAAARHVMVVPEIDMPGHNSVATFVLPELLLCPNNPYRPGNKPWDDKESYKWMEPCTASPKAMAVYQNILDEVIQLFPAPYIHLGGDEYFGLAWDRCPDCQRLLDTEHLRAGETSEMKRLYAKSIGSKRKYLWYRWWMAKMCDYVRAQGRKPILWDDLAWRGRFSEGVTILQWHSPRCHDGWLNRSYGADENPVAEAALAGRDAIVAPCDHLYFNDGEGVDSSPKAIYQVDIVSPSLPLEKRRHILGPHGCVWEQPQEDVDKWVIPRLYSLAEIACSPRKSRTGKFSRHMRQHQERPHSPRIAPEFVSPISRKRADEAFGEYHVQRRRFLSQGAFLHVQETGHRLVPEGWADGVKMVSGIGATACGTDDGDDRLGVRGGRCWNRCSSRGCRRRRIIVLLRCWRRLSDAGAGCTYTARSRIPIGIRAVVVRWRIVIRIRAVIVGRRISRANAHADANRKTDANSDSSSCLGRRP